MPFAVLAPGGQSGNFWIHSRILYMKLFEQLRRMHSRRFMVTVTTILCTNRPDHKGTYGCWCEVPSKLDVGTTYSCFHRSTVALPPSKCTRHVVYALDTFLNQWRREIAKPLPKSVFLWSAAAVWAIFSNNRNDCRYQPQIVTGNFQLPKWKCTLRSYSLNWSVYSWCH
jgi:hypothetical protein